MCRYFCVSRVIEAEKDEDGKQSFEEEEEVEQSYETFMCGGAISDGYVGFAG